MSDTTKQKKQENVAMYFVYAAAAYFGLQFLLKRPAAAATVTNYNPDKTAAQQTPQDEVITTVYDPVPVTKQVKSSTTKWIAESFPLRKGMKGTKVAVLQMKLGVNADGAFGDKTEAALLRQYGTKSLSLEKFKTIVQATSTSIKSTSTDKSTVLKMGSKGPDVYRLQKWLGFKDKKAAKKGEPVADSAFGKITQTTLQKKTGLSAISLNQLSILISGGGAKGIGSMGFLGEVVITKKDTIIFNGNLQPHCQVKKNTILGRRILDLEDRQQQKTFTQFQTIDGFRRWVDKEAA